MTVGSGGKLGLTATVHTSLDRSATRCVGLSLEKSMGIEVVNMSTDQYLC